MLAAQTAINISHYLPLYLQHSNMPHPLTKIVVALRQLFFIR